MPPVFPPSYPGVITPVLTSTGTATGSYQFPPFGAIRPGPYEYSGSLNFVLMYEEEDSWYLTVFRSTDQGVTWEEADPENRPAMTATDLTYYLYDVDEAGATLRIVHSNPLTVDVFSMSSGEWLGRETAAGPELTEALAWTPRLFVRHRNGIDHCFFTQAWPEGGNIRGVYATWNGTSWSSPVQVMGFAGFARNEEFGEFDGDDFVIDLPVGLEFDSTGILRFLALTDGDAEPWGEVRLKHRAWDGENWSVSHLVDDASYLAANFNDNDVILSAPYTIRGKLQCVFARRAHGSTNESVELCRGEVGLSLESPWIVEVIPGTKNHGSGHGVKFEVSIENPGVSIAALDYLGNAHAVYRSNSASTNPNSTYIWVTSAGGQWLPLEDLFSPYTAEQSYVYARKLSDHSLGVVLCDKANEETGPFSEFFMLVFLRLPSKFDVPAGGISYWAG